MTETPIFFTFQAELLGSLGAYLKTVFMVWQLALMSIPSKFHPNFRQRLGQLPQRKLINGG